MNILKFLRASTNTSEDPKVPVIMWLVIGGGANSKEPVLGKLIEMYSINKH
jgi:hypothetical protein